MKEKQLAWQVSGMDQQETFFRLIDPEDYARLGIDPQDVPMGTFASEDHPSFLPSRFGGNAYGLGLVEQSVLTRADTDFLESMDFQDIRILGENARKLNAIYQKLGLLIRFSQTGKRYFLIPINLVAHSLQEVKAKADEIEELIIRHIWETRNERLDIGLLTPGHDLIVHELTARLSNHRITLFESIDKLCSWRLPMDIILLPKDMFEYLLDQQLPNISKRPLGRKRLFQYATYLAGKIYDLLDPSGKIIVLAHSPGPEEDQSCHIRFKSEEDLKSFLLFSHIFKTRKHYGLQSAREGTNVHISDLHYYLNRFAFFDPHVKRLLDRHKLEELTPEYIDALPHLNLRLPEAQVSNPEKQWKWIFETYFKTLALERKKPRQHHAYWQDRLEIDRELPETLCVYMGQPRQPEIALDTLEKAIKASGMQGCPLPLVAGYRNTFRYVLSVLQVLLDIRENRFSRLSELERTRLTNPFRTRSESFAAIQRLMKQIPRLKRIRDLLNPDFIEGQTTPILENIPKLSLYGFSPAQLQEILLIVVGHSTMSRVVFGKLPAKTLRPLTDRGKDGNSNEIMDQLRLCRLVSLAEIAAALGDSFTVEQARELYRLYDAAVYVTTDPNLTWEKLHDLSISDWGGVQNKAVREMMKLLNLFEFLDNWQEFKDKGASQKEVHCDYQPEKLEHLEEALELARIAKQFKQQFMSDYVFGQSYFFRQCLEAEFHGTGHLFPKLGSRAGFILLWITVNSAGRNIINFNPMLSGTPPDRVEQRITKIRDCLLRIPIESLQPGFFEETQKRLAADQPAFIFDSGIRIAANLETRVLDVSFVEVSENIQQIEGLLSFFESHRLRGISLKSLQDLERLFSELESFHSYLHQEGCSLQCDLFGRPEGLQAKERDIGQIEQRLKTMLRSQIFLPEEIHENLSVLAEHCPVTLRFVLPELHAFGAIVESVPTRVPQTLGTYVMACLEKYQALITKDRNGFQDRNAFYQLAKQEFGPLAEEGIGASHAQLDILEYVVDRIQQRPQLYQALTLALLFQDIGKVEAYAVQFPEIQDCWTHAARGAMILSQSDILAKYGLEPQVERLIVYLVRHHGLFGHVIRGEEPVTALGRTSVKRDDRLLDVLLLHSILAAAAVQEGVMICDMLEGFLTYRAVAIQLIKSDNGWSSWLRQFLREKGEAVLSGQLPTCLEAIPVMPGEDTGDCGFGDEDVEDRPLWHGRQVAAFERLIKLMGAAWVDYQDVVMHLQKIPVNFIYHKKKLKSVGFDTFEEQLGLATELYEIMASLGAEVRYYLLYCLDHLGVALRIYDFHSIPPFLDPSQSLKLLLIGFRAYHDRFGIDAKEGLISFKHLSLKIHRRHEALQKMLRDLSFPENCFDADRPFAMAQSYGELVFMPSGCEPALSIDYRDAIEFGHMVRSLNMIWDHDELGASYDSLLQELHEKLPYDTEDLEAELRKVFRDQQKRVNDLILKQYQEKLVTAMSFAGLQTIWEEAQARRIRVGFTEDQQYMFEEMFEFHRSRLRDRYLDIIYRRINSFRARNELSNYWDQLKHELVSYRSYVGKEYELLIAEFIDLKMQRG